MINENTLAFFTFFFKKKKPNKQTNKYLLIMIFLLRDFKFYRLWFVFSGRYCFIMNVMVLVLYGPSSLSYKALFKLLHTFQVRMTFSVSNTSTLWVGNIVVAEGWSQMEKFTISHGFLCYLVLVISLSQTIFVHFNKNLHIRKRLSYPCQCFYIL